MKIAIFISDCIDKCTINVKVEQIAACAYICEMDHGYANIQFLGRFPTHIIINNFKHTSLSPACLGSPVLIIEAGF